MSVLALASHTHSECSEGVPAFHLHVRHFETRTCSVATDELLLSWGLLGGKLVHQELLRRPLVGCTSPGRTLPSLPRALPSVCRLSPAVTPGVYSVPGSFQNSRPQTYLTLTPRRGGPVPVHRGRTAGAGRSAWEDGRSPRALPGRPAAAGDTRQGFSFRRAPSAVGSGRIVVPSPPISRAFIVCPAFVDTERS